MEMSRKGFGANAYVALDHGGNQKAHWPAAQRFDLMKPNRIDGTASSGERHQTGRRFGP
jgi:hypothetical protein